MIKTIKRFINALTGLTVMSCSVSFVEGCAYGPMDEDHHAPICDTLGSYCDGNLLVECDEVGSFASEKPCWLLEQKCVEHDDGTAQCEKQTDQN